MSDAWNEIQAIKSKRNSLREKLEKRKRERHDILIEATSATGSVAPKIEISAATADDKRSLHVHRLIADPDAADPDVERLLLQILSDQALVLPIKAKQLFQRMNSLRFKSVAHEVLNYYLEKLATQSYISIGVQAADESSLGDATSTSRSADDAAPPQYEVTQVEHGRVQSLYEEMEEDADVKIEDVKRKCKAAQLMMDV